MSGGADKRHALANDRLRGRVSASYEVIHLFAGDRINFKHSLFGLRQKCGVFERRVESAADDRDQFLRRFGRHTPKLPDYRTPTLIVNGEHDNALSGGTRTAALIRHAVHKVCREPAI